MNSVSANSILAVKAHSFITSPLFKNVLSSAGPFFFFLLQISGLRTVWDIRKNQTTVPHQYLPFLSLLVNGVIWSTYGFLSMNVSIYGPNLSCAAFGAFYCYMYAQYKPQTESLVNQNAIGLAIAAVTVAVAMTLQVAFATKVIGSIGACISLLLMSSPLAQINQVITQKSSAMLPFWFTVAAFCNSATWTAYGYLIINDPFVFIPNGLGLLSTFVQLSLFVLYPAPVKATYTSLNTASETINEDKRDNSDAL
jgi:uncharacterized protein with PQ loop repeat